LEHCSLNSWRKLLILKRWSRCVSTLCCKYMRSRLRWFLCITRFISLEVMRDWISVTSWNLQCLFVSCASDELMIACWNLFELLTGKKPYICEGTKAKTEIVLSMRHNQACCI
jgi:hypothetical protein